MEQKKIRPLRPEEVEVRVNKINESGCSLLLYKDARCDKRILDETFGIYGWRNSYEEIKGNLFCTLSIWDEDKQQWINKQDCGVESYAEKEKGEASDAFKRACFNIGIGRELYTKIFIWIKVETVKDGTANGKDKYRLKDRFEKFNVSKMTVDTENEKITELKICNSDDIEVFSWKTGKKTKQNYQVDNTETESVKCKSCGDKIEGCTSTKGKYLTAYEVAKKTNWLCKNCHAKSKENKTN